MFREKEICNAIRTAYLYLFPDKKERKRALSRLDMELVAQSVRDRGESVLAYQTAGNHYQAAGTMAEKTPERPGTMKGAAYEGYFSQGAERA